ncbi:MAG: hypothetical protein A2172_04520 [Candidatus Woykebacteria bacterium RBG_13_40_15]|uniref:Uncharacterized protein n=1 Tax=Candidatus Woykebacteria bacterium RBG_13_40_15 TaxID=1802593 RepID=A0A1G1W714_9BACT|nr:MAG: hypothetical protein A2172_04520 [Candidatus Woykebacteria bacterium RBG_13_40_15]
MRLLNKFKKVKGIKDLGKYNLPTPETIFIFDFEKQEKEIDDFIKNRRYLMIRSDKENDIDFCPHNLVCPKAEAKDFIKGLVSKKYVVILQECIPWQEDKISGNILTLKNEMLIELMKGGPLTLLNREGNVDESIKIKRKNLGKREYSGRRIIKKKDLDTILRMVKGMQPYKIVEFSIGPNWLYFWQIRDDKTAKELEG